jgi:hypothetical protein
MSPRIFESPFTWLNLIGILAPPRDPNNNNDEDEEDEDEDEDEDEEDKREPAVIREPDNALVCYTDGIAHIDQAGPNSNLVFYMAQK